MKKCIKCGLEKDENEYYKQVNKNLRIGTCKACHNEIMKKWQKENRDKAKKAWTKFNRKRRKGRICKFCGSNYKIANSQQGCSLKCRFELAVERKENGCWHWLKGKKGNGRNGYGSMSINGKHMVASRISYELHKGPITEGLYVLHTCDNPICVNPNHLYLGTNQQNMNDMKNRGRSQKGKNLFRKYSKQQCQNVFRLRQKGKIYKEISQLTGVKESMCKFICKNPQRLDEVPL